MPEGQPRSPNHGERRGTNRPDLIVIHYTGMPDTDGARARLCDPLAEVSAHWLIDLDGTTEPLVPEDRRAWHAGAGSWMGRGDVNSHSIGIELANPGDQPFPEPQMAALETLLRGIMDRWSIPAHRVIGHSDMAPGRKSDPGPRFDWGRLARQGLALAATPQPARQNLDRMLDRIGYPPAAPDTRLAAFRLRFCPWNAGEANDTDRRMAAGVLAALQTLGKDIMQIYKVLRADEWAALQAAGETDGAPVDLADGYVHFSTAAQLRSTLDKHFAGQDGLTLLTCDAGQMAGALRWEPSRGGDLFPHLYRPLRMADVISARPLPRAADGFDLEDL